MTITKYGHACLLVELNGVFLLTDPGMWNPLPDAESVDAILLTHEHQDHADIDQLKKLKEKHPDVRIITHESVGKKLEEASMSYEVIHAEETLEVKGVSVESFGTEHAAIYGASPCQNTGYLIGGELFVTGDALHDVPSKPVRVLALPTGGPWMKIAEAIDYAKKVKPAIVFPVHDAMYIEDYQLEFVPWIIGRNLPEGITFVDMPPGTTKEF